MNFKDMLLPLGLALITVFAIQRFFFSSNKGQDSSGQGARSGQSFVAPRNKMDYRPLNREIDFIDEKRLHKAVMTEVETDLAKLVFSNDGASLERLEIKRKLNGKPSLINTVFPVGQKEREDKCFLVALENKTPYYYKLLGTSETDSAIEVRYQYRSPVSDVNINKTYTIFKETYKVNLKVEVEQKKELEEGVRARIFFPSPFTPEIPGTPSAVVVNEKGSVERKPGGKLDAQTGWFNPELFGGDSKYFLNVMVEDADKFVQRAYYRAPSDKKLFSILEGPNVQKPTSWTVSFYFGPKEEGAMARVDERLEQTLEYSGLLAPIAKFLLWFLKLLKEYVGNYGLAIIILTLLIRLFLLPFTMRAEEGMKKRLELQKKLKYVEQKYKNDKETLNRTKAELIRKHGMPGVGGCLPLLLQVPVFFALSRVLSSSIEFYKAPFVFWIHDLSAKDPYYVLPVLLVLAMLAQALTGEKSQRFMVVAMALVLGAFVANLAAGLALYIMMSSLLGVLQTTIQKRWKRAA